MISERTVAGITPSSHAREIERLKANAARCEAMAGGATDPEVREALLQIASDIAAALSILEQDGQAPVGNP